MTVFELDGVFLPKKLTEGARDRRKGYQTESAQREEEPGERTNGPAPREKTESGGVEEAGMDEERRKRSV